MTVDASCIICAHPLVDHDNEVGCLSPVQGRESCFCLLPGELLALPVHVSDGRLGIPLALRDLTTWGGPR